MDGRHGCEGGSICIGVPIDIDYGIELIFNDSHIDNKLSLRITVHIQMGWRSSLVEESDGTSTCGTCGGNEDMIGSPFGPNKWSLIYTDLRFL